MQATSPREFFEKVLPLRFKADKAAGVDVIVQVNITGSNGGSWTAKVKDQTLEVAEGVYASPTLTLQMADRDFVELVNGKLSPEKAFFTGKIQFKGDIALALKLRETGFL
ncbi:MAG: SCP2 sterol-binding domain-containing protein [Candidatus Bathyarchaeota archaeon]|nr:SCP2 sterol-binding domain-containing protein [Candidatus Bathyarchaeota archaeon]